MKPFKYNPNQNTGSFRHRITFYSFEIIEDELGQQLERQIEHSKAWAAIKTVKGSEYLNAGTVRGELIYRFIIPYVPGITNDMKLSYNGRLFDIIEPPINDDELNKTLTIIAKERV